ASKRNGATEALADGSMDDSMSIAVSLPADADPTAGLASVDCVADRSDAADGQLNAAYLVEASGLFDREFYLNSNPDVASAGLNPLLHFLTCGFREGRSPHPLFDTRFYLLSNPDVAVAGENPLLHYLLRGPVELRDPHPLFDTA